MWICNFDKGEYFKGIVRFTTESNGLIAQSVEHRPFKAGVPGSSPGQPTIFLYLLLSIYMARDGFPILSLGSEVLK